MQTTMSPLAPPEQPPTSRDGKYFERMAVHSASTLTVEAQNATLREDKEELSPPVRSTGCANDLPVCGNKGKREGGGRRGGALALLRLKQVDDVTKEKATCAQAFPSFSLTLWSKTVWR